MRSTDMTVNGYNDHRFTFMHYIYIYSFSRRFYPKRLTIEEYDKRYIIKRQTVTGSACNTTFQALFRAKPQDRERLRKESKGVFFMKKKQKPSEEWKR